MRYAVLIGSDMFIGTTGILEYEDANGQFKEFLRVREIHRERCDGSYLALDVDIKDTSGNREVKLAKSRPVVEGEDVKVIYEKTVTTVERKDGTIVLKVEQLPADDPTLHQDGSLAQELASGDIDAVIRITGSFNVGAISISATNESTTIGTLVSRRNTMRGTRGIRLRNNGISFG